VELVDHMAVLFFGFFFLRSFHIAFQSGFASLHSHQQCYEGSFLPASSPTFVGGGVLDAS
jgi:hypothetical protein